MIVESRFGCKPVRNCINAMAWAAVFCLMAVGCGGGGGGGGTAPGLTYSGLDTPAVITADNADSIAASALEGGVAGSTFTGVAGLAGPGQADVPGRPFLADATRLLEGVVAEIDFQADGVRNLSAAVQSESGSMNGACGGNASYSIQVDTDTGVFSGSMSFNSYCEDGMTLSGGTTFSGAINLATDELESFTFSFNYITGTSASGSFAMAGQLTITATGSTVTATMDMMMQDGTGRVCQVENYQMAITDWGSYAAFTISGRFYDPDYGYVDLTTPSPLFMRYIDDYPYAGQLVLTGENGTVGPTSARLTAHSATTCQVEADIDGNGTYDGPPVDYDSEVILWTEL